MTFVSYAQNFEDVMLWRALKHVENGFYVDVGALDPNKDSVTKAFYDNGWRGINIEPVESSYLLLRKDRSDDINLQIAVADKEAVSRFFEIDTGLSTLQADIAQRYRAQGFDVRAYDVVTRTLDDILEEYKGDREIQFLKIDVEGAEGAVLSGLDLSRFRPWIILAEATEPNSTNPAYQSWEPLLTQHGYDMVYFDGLNRFYLAEEHTELAEFFETPPNVFDNFVHAHLRKAQSRIAALEARLSEAARRGAARSAGQRSVDAAAGGPPLEPEHTGLREIQRALAEESIARRKLESDLASVNAMLTKARRRNNRLGRELQAVYSSASWRFTAPVRAVRGYFRRAIQRVHQVVRSALPEFKHMCKRPLVSVMAWVMRRPRIARPLNRLLKRFPALRFRLVRLAGASGLFFEQAPDEPLAVRQQTPKAGSRTAQRVNATPPDYLSDGARQIFEAFHVGDGQPGQRSN